MSNTEPKYSVEQEYEALRSEISKGKQYVFERPLLIISGSIALIEFVDKAYAIYLPSIIIALLFYNIWFTVNRMQSIARIIAYIQLVLENKDHKWYGWETSLRKYRKWLHKENIDVNKVKIDKTVVYDNLGFYPSIYNMHIVASITATAALGIYVYNNFKSPNTLVFGMTCIIFIAFMIYIPRIRPKKVKPQIEQNRKLWEDVYENWDEIKD